MKTVKDSMGSVEVPDSAMYGASTERARGIFDVSGYRMPAPFIHALGAIKAACARANGKLENLDSKYCKAIITAAEEVAQGMHDDQFPVDVFQTGSGTSTNMNANEVIAMRATAQLREAGQEETVHPNDHVNLGQSSNDIIPTVLNVSTAIELQHVLKPALQELTACLNKKKEEFSDIIKIGRTHLMDATPMTLGQQFSGFAAQVEACIQRCDRAIELCKPLAIGGTAVGTGAFTHNKFAGEVCSLLHQATDMEFVETENHFAAQSANDHMVEIAGHLSAITVCFERIANDIRWMSSGPRCGLNEIKLPALQPGSSIMPGKVNPVMSEMLIQLAVYVRGQCQTVAAAAGFGNLQLLTSYPLIAHCIHESVRLLANGANKFTRFCVLGIEANAEQCEAYVERSLMLATNLSPHIGYDKASELAKKAYAENRPLREVVAESGLVDEETLDAALDPKTMLGS